MVTIRLYRAECPVPDERSALLLELSRVPGVGESVSLRDSTISGKPSLLLETRKVVSVEHTFGSLAAKVYLAAPDE